MAEPRYTISAAAMQQHRNAKLVRILTDLQDYIMPREATDMVREALQLVKRGHTKPKNTKRKTTKKKPAKTKTKKPSGNEYLEAGWPAWKQQPTPKKKRTKRPSKEAA